MVDRLFEAMSNTQRRRVLVVLLEHDSQEDVPIPEAIHEGEKTLTGLRREMHHSHLPKLEAMGYVRWDRDTQTVTRGPQFEEIAPLLRLLRTNEDALPAEFP